MSGAEFHYKPPPPRVKHTDEGKRRIASAQHALKVTRIAKATGLSRDEVAHKLELGLGYCPRHGWKPWPRCLECKSETAKKTRQKKRKLTAPELVRELQKQQPVLASKVSTGAELEPRGQLDFSFARSSR